MMKDQMLMQDIKNLLAFQGDAHLQTEICKSKQFNLIHGCNLIDRLHTPQHWVLQSKVASMINL